MIVMYTPLVKPFQMPAGYMTLYVTFILQVAILGFDAACCLFCSCNRISW